MLASTLRRARLAPPPVRAQGGRRGGQPGNHNALKHGIYARTSRLPAVSIRLAHNTAGDAPPSNLDLLEGALLGADRIMSAALDLMESSHPAKFGQGCNAFSSALNLFARISILKFQMALPQARLVSLARQASLLIDWEFRRIPQHPVFVPLSVANSDANSSKSCSVLTDAQWLLVKDLFRSLHAALDAGRSYTRHKPLPDDRRLLRGILIKLAFGLRWCDLAPLGFVPRLCRTRYRQLYLSGRMSAIYSQLHRHLVIHGDASLADLAQQGFFRWQRPRISLSPGQRLTWQNFTALLLLQRAQRNQRVIARKLELLRRRRAAYLRSAAPRLGSSGSMKVAPNAAAGHHEPSTCAQGPNAAPLNSLQRGHVSAVCPGHEAVLASPFP